MSLVDLFKTYCQEKIRGIVTPVPEERKQEIVRSLGQSEFKSIIQAYSVLDFYDYCHIQTEGFDRYFGYDNASVTAESILEIVHPEDQEAFGQLYYLCLEGLLAMPFPTKDIGHFCISYRMRDAYGKYHRITETNNIIECCPVTNIPLINLAQITLHQGYYKSDKVSWFFKIRDEQQSIKIMTEHLGQFDSKVNIFSDNELKLIQLLKRGFKSKEIAEQLFLSKHTIDKYRKTLLEKTQCTNTPQLISYTENLGLI